MKLSLIVPLYNEEDNISRLEKELTEALDAMKILEDYEVLCINDGSTDKTLENLKQIKNPKFKSFSHDKNYGLTAGIYSGIHQANFDIVGYIDGDLQTDPKELEKLLFEIKNGYNGVNGKRAKPKAGIIRNIVSKIGHTIPKWYLKTQIEDVNCPLQVFEKRCLINITFYKNFHRFLPYLIEMQGYKVKEIPIAHFPRIAGKSKYNSTWKRMKEGIKLLWLMKWMKKNQIQSKIKQEN